MTLSTIQKIKMKTKKVFVLLVLLAFNQTVFANDYNFTAAKSILNGYVNTNKLAGGVILVMKDGEELLHFASGMQDIEANKAMQVDSIFRIASQTKALTSVGVMILKDRGLLKVTDPVSKYIPAFKKTTVLVVNEDKSHSIVPAQREITIHDLLTHTSGISYGAGPIEEQWKSIGLYGWYFADKDQSIAEALAPITTLPQKAQPGTDFIYGHNVDLLGVIIETVSNKSLKDFFKEEITHPLGMKDTHFYLPASKKNRLAAVYNSTDTVIKRADDADKTSNFMTSQGHYVDGPQKAYSGGGGLLSTARDYAKFLSMLLNKGSLSGTKILSQASVKEMISNQTPDNKKPAWLNGLSFGYGFGLTIAKEGTLKGKTIRYEWGGAYNSKYYVRPEDGVIVVYLTQLKPTKGLKDWAEIDAVINIALGIKN
jgi:CubicO group peptidase (beta-lactamase class C family)